MEKWRPYFHHTKPIDELIKQAVVVVDTNVLLSAYQWRDVTVNEMTSTLSKLSNEGRLKIPLQVIEEFFKNRPNQILQRVNDIENMISGLQSPPKLNKIVPIFEGKENYEEVSKIQIEYEEIQKRYRESLKNLRDDLKKLFIQDSFLDELKIIIQKSYFEPLENTSEEELIKTAEKRFKSKTPPGYKDSPKDENSIGDFIIWDSIKKLKSDVVFVSRDKKTDWVYQDKHDNPVGTRRELIEEFLVDTGGFDFMHISPREFITLLNPDVSEDVKEDLSQINAVIEVRASNNLESIEEQILGIIKSFNPYPQNNEKDTEKVYKFFAREISKNVNSISTYSEMLNLAMSVIPFDDNRSRKIYFNMVRALHHRLVMFNVEE